MIEVQGLLAEIPHFATFCSVAKLQGLVERLQRDSRFSIAVAGTSVNGAPIHHVRFGSGSVKALFVAYPHCMEPIGGLTVFSLMALLQQNERALVEVDVEWNIVPCIDPDGALLNEGWTQQPFTIGNYMRNFYAQPTSEQVDFTFPLAYKKLVFDRPAREARVLQDIIDKVRPDFYYSLHDHRANSGAAYLLTRPMNEKYYRQLHELLQQHRIPLNAAVSPKKPQLFAAGIARRTGIKGAYDELERRMLRAEELLAGVGASAPEYLEDSAQCLTAELSYIKHPADGSPRDTGQSLRQFKLRIDADNKYLAAVILEEWDKLAGELDPASPFHRKISSELVAARRTLHEALPLTWAYDDPTRAILFDPAHGGCLTEGHRLYIALMHRLTPLCNGYCFVRLLKASQQTAGVRQAIERLEQMFDQALADLSDEIDIEAFEVIDCDALARVQLGSGLIVLNSVLEARAS